MHYLRPILLLFIITYLTSGCQKNPATGESEINLMSEQEEDSIGKNEHQKIINQFGGEYKGLKLNNYINSIGNFLVSTSELPDKEFKFTILDTPIVNAFALPGGYVYLTRGLIYLCQNEAQLAGVIAHEIGHITARHSAKRYTKTVGTGVILQVLNIFSKNNFLNNLLGQSAQLFLLSYSRSQEYQADQLAVRYMTRAGFDAQEMANFLRIMEKFSNLQNKILKIDNNVSELLKTHPNSSKRIQEVIDNYKGKIPLNPIIGKEIFLKKIDGLLYGHKPEEGFFVNNNFIHKSLKIAFEFDKDFYFLNNPKVLIGKTKKKTRVIFDLEETNEKNDLDYLSKWISLPKKKILDFQSFLNNDFTISTAKSTKGNQLIFVGLIRGDENLTYRFILISNEEEFKTYARKFEKIILSFRKLNEKDLSILNPPHIKIASTTSNPNYMIKTLQQLNLQTMFSREIFNVINDIDSNIVEVGNKIKLIH